MDILSEECERCKDPVEDLTDYGCERCNKKFCVNHYFVVKTKNALKPRIVLCQNCIERYRREGHEVVIL